MIWQPPEADIIKVNVDVGLPDRMDFLVVSMVTHDSSRNCIWWSVKKIHGHPPPTDGEAMAVLFGIQVARSRGWRRVMIETDCYPIYAYLANGHRTLVSFGAILDSCLELCPLFSSLSFSFIKRSGNSLAHSIATADGLSCSEGTSFPPFLID